jgi:hypothetical protein
MRHAGELETVITGAHGAGSVATVEHGRIWPAAVCEEKAAHREQ